MNMSTSWIRQDVEQWTAVLDEIADGRGETPPLSPELRDFAAELAKRGRVALERLRAVPEEEFDGADAPWAQKQWTPGWDYELACADWHVSKLSPWFLEEEARWLLLVRGLPPCPNEFERGVWLPLVARDLGLVRWLVDSAAWVEALSGVATGDALRECLPRLEALRPGAGQELRELARATGPLASAARVLLGVGDGTRTEGIGAPPCEGSFTAREHHRAIVVPPRPGEQ